MITQENQKKSKSITLKPVSKDIYYQYICTECGCHHWIKHKEASSKNFHIICDCEITIRPKRIIDTKIVYEKNIKKKKKTKKNKIKKPNKLSEVDTSVEPKIENVDNNFTDNQQKAISALKSYGFTQQELEPVVKLCVEQDEVAKLVKETLTRIGKQHEYFYNQTYEF